MPAKDRYHDTVVRALRKAGWTITAEQFLIVVEERNLWIDIHAEKESERLAILVEVKGFENAPSPVESLANAAGKYTLYLVALEYIENPLPLYLAISTAEYNGILSEAIGKQTLRRIGIRLIVFDSDAEEIVQWIEQ